MSKIDDILAFFDKTFPNVYCELNYSNDIQLIIAVVLSAQTTDKAVNKVTDVLYASHPTIEHLVNLSISDLENYIKQLGLYKNKSKNVYLLIKDVYTKYNKIVPKNYDNLISLPGVGRKTANVFLAEFCNVPVIAVDTHVERVSKRLKLAYLNDNVLTVEKKLMSKFPKESWIKLHHQLIHFGRYFCKARNPRCSECELKNYCRNKSGIVKY